MTEPQTIGIVGGMSPESTLVYYQQIIRHHVATCGDHRYPRLVITSVSFQQYIDWQHAGEWERIAAGLQAEFAATAAAGADFAILATNTMHKVLPAIASPIPVWSILDAVADGARQAGVARLGLTGTRFTMSDGFYAAGLIERGLEVVVPEAADQEAIHRMIYDDLIRGVVRPEAIQQFAAIADRLAEQGAAAIVLGCTELEFLTRDSPLPLPTLDSTRLHAEGAWEIAVGRRPLQG